MIVGALAALALAPAGASAATVHVSTGGNDSTCAPDGGACLTLAQGIAVAAAGDTVEVGPGTFDAPGLRVTEQLNLRGAQAGVDARGRTANGAGETVLSHLSGPPNDGLLNLTAAAAGTTVDGFQFTGNQGSANFAGAGLITGGGGGFTISNDIFTGNSIGLYLSSAGAATAVRHDQFVDTADTNTPASGNAIYSERAEHVTISDNTFIGNPSAGVIHAVSGGSDVTFADNAIEGQGFTFAHINGLTVSGNTFSGQARSGIQLGGDGLRDANLIGNTITDRTLAGIRLLQFGGPQSDQNSDVTIHQNTITGADSSDPTQGNGILIGDHGAGGPITIANNRIVNNSGAGLRNEDDDADVDARHNWWGCNDGPGFSGCDSVISPNGGANPSFTPWLLLSLDASPTAIAAGGQSTLLARLGALSSGGLADGPFFDSGRATFGSTPAGSFSPETAPLSAAALEGSSAFTAAGKPTELRTTVDHQIVRITIEDPPAPDVIPDVVPQQHTLTPGQKAAIIIRLVNRGNRTARRLRACLSLSAKLHLSGHACRAIARLRPGHTLIFRVRARAALNACPGRVSYRLRVRVQGERIVVRRILGRLRSANCRPPCPSVAPAGRHAHSARASLPADRPPRKDAVRAHVAC